MLRTISHATAPRYPACAPEWPLRATSGPLRPLRGPIAAKNILCALRELPPPGELSRFAVHLLELLELVLLVLLVIMLIPLVLARPVVVPLILLHSPDLKYRNLVRR